MSNKPPANILSQIDYGSTKTAIGFFSTLLKLHDQKRQGVIRAMIKKYDRSSGVATVIPLVKYTCDTPQGQVSFDRPEYTVRVMRCCHGGFVVDIPLFAGDTGWLVAGDRNSDTCATKNSAILKEDMEFNDDGSTDGPNEGQVPPDDNSLQNYAWGFFVPDFWGNNEIGDRDGIVVKYMPNNDSGAGGFEINANANGIAIERKTTDGGKTDKIILNNDGIKYEGEHDREQQVLTDLRYDIGTHQIQKKVVVEKIRGDFVVEVGKESDWIMIDGGQAVPGSEG